MRFQCSSCQCILDIDDCAPGEMVVCGQCGATVEFPASPTSPTAMLGDFAIVRELGQGGMGKVYLARQVSLDRNVALKVLNAGYAENVSFIRNFINEARVAASLNHPNIVQAYAVSMEYGLYYFAMEYVEGKTLKEILQEQQRLPAGQVLGIALDIVSALDYAWRECRLLHRDIKPDNIMITQDGRTKLADLGLAMRQGGGIGVGEQELFGTPQYLAPELLLKQPHDSRSDMYSLGGTLYQALTGRYPYVADSLEALVWEHGRTPLKPIASLVQEEIPGLSTVIEILLAKRPLQRYQDFPSLLQDLQAVKDGKEIQAALAPDSQTPIDFDSEDPLALPEKTPAKEEPEAADAAGKGAGRTGGRFVLGRKGEGGLVLKGAKGTIALPGSKKKKKKKDGDAEPDAGATGTAGVTRAAGAAGAAGRAKRPSGGREGAGRSRRGLVVAGVVAALVALLALGGAAAFRLRRSPGGGGKGAAAAAGRAAAGPERRADRLGKLRKLVKAGGGSAAALKEMAVLSIELDSGSPEYAEYLRLCGDALEEQVAACRRERLEQLKAAWLEKVEDFRLQHERELKEAAERSERERLAAEAAAEKRRREEAAARRAAELKAKKSKAIEDMVVYARDFDFDSGIRGFDILAVELEEKDRPWAQCWIKCLRNAAKAFGLIHDSDRKYAGVKLVFGRSEWFVEEIQFSDLKIYSEAPEKGRGKGARKRVEKELDLAILGNTALRTLVHAAMEKEGLADDRDEWFGCLLWCRGGAEAFARNLLEKTGGYAPLLEDSQEMRTAYVRSWIRLLKDSKYSAADARIIYADLKRRYAEETAQADQQLQETIESKKTADD